MRNADHVVEVSSSRVAITNKGEGQPRSAQTCVQRGVRVRNVTGFLHAL